MLPTASARTFQPEEELPGQQTADELISEPIFTTVTRDVKAVSDKFKYVMMPASRTEKGGILKQWDLWGPLFLSLVMASILWTQAEADQKRSVFALSFSLGWVGAGVVTLNASLLGANISFFQSISILNYCLFPVCCSALVCVLIPHSLNFLRLLVAGAAVYWAVGVSSSFIGSLVREDRKILANYPVYLFYVIYAWLIVLM